MHTLCVCEGGRGGLGVWTPFFENQNLKRTNLHDNVGRNRPVTTPPQTPPPEYKVFLVPLSGKNAGSAQG